MNFVLATAVGLLFAIGTWQLLSRDLIRLALGMYLIFNASNLLIMSLGTVPGYSPPFAFEAGVSVDPLAQTMVLTAIVIGFGLSNFLLLLAARLGRATGTLDADEISTWRR